VTIFDTIPTLARALSERQYNDPTPVQKAVLTREAEGRDILVSAQTGSGKTVAYGLAMAKSLMGHSDIMPRADSPLALIVAPTRELALQVERELAWLYANTQARIVSCVGGMDARAERRKLSDGVHIVVGTPGRLRDHIERGGLVLSGLKAVVLDEADEMLALGFREDLEFILKATPVERRTLLFSATMPKGIVALAKRYQRDAMRIEVANTEGGHSDIEYRAIRVAPKETELAVVNLLRFVDAQTSIVFCNTREAVRHLQATLQERGFSVVLLSGELSQHERNNSMQALRDGRARICVATDVAARGIDLPNLGLVVHAELPHDAEALQHRSGRTGRAGKKGISALLVPPMRRRRAELMLQDAGVEAVWMGPPSADEIRAMDNERLLKDPVLLQDPSDEDLVMAQRLMSERPVEQLLAALVGIYRSKLPAIEDITDPASWQGSESREGNRRDRDGGRDRNAKPPRNDSGPRPERAPRVEMAGPRVIFRLHIGRKQNADPKWLLPMLCRKGGVERQDIGAIRIFEHETKVEVAQGSAEQFIQSMNKPGGENIRCERISDGDMGGSERGSERGGDRDRGPRGAGKPFGKPSFGKPSSGGRSDNGRPDHGRPDHGKPSFGKSPFEKPARGKPSYGKSASAGGGGSYDPVKSAEEAPLRRKPRKDKPRY
jgi:ATP-dependent RNA helicase DeaD